MALINYDQKWLFLFEPYTASRATRHSLLSIPGTEPVGDQHHADIVQLTNRKSERSIKLEVLFDFQVIATVRNPFDALITRLMKPRMGLPNSTNFPEFLRKNLLSGHLALDRPMEREMWAKATTICYYENLQEDLRNLFDVALIDIPPYRTKGKQHWSKYYDNDIIDRLLVHWTPFLMRFGYYFANAARTEMIVEILRRLPRIDWHEPGTIS